MNESGQRGQVGACAALVGALELAQLFDLVERTRGPLSRALEAIGEVACVSQAKALFALDGSRERKGDSQGSIRSGSSTRQSVASEGNKSELGHVRLARVSPQPRLYALPGRLGYLYSASL